MSHNPPSRNATDPHGAVAEAEQSTSSSPLQGTDREIEQFIEMTFSAADVPHQAGIERLDVNMSLKEKVWPPPTTEVEPKATTQEIDLDVEFDLDDLSDTPPASSPVASPVAAPLPIVNPSLGAGSHAAGVGAAITPLRDERSVLDDATRTDDEALFSDDPLPLPALKVQQPKRQLTLIGVDVREFLAAARNDGGRKLAIVLVALTTLTVGVLATGYALRHRIVHALSPVLPPETEADKALSPGLQAKEAYVSAINAVQKGQLKTAQELLGRVLTLDPSLVTAHRSLGIVYAKLGDKDRASDHYRRYVSSVPDGPDAAKVKQVVQAYDDAQARAHAEALAAAAAEEARVKAEAAKQALAEEKARAAASRSVGRTQKKAKSAKPPRSGAPGRPRAGTAPK